MKNLFENFKKTILLCVKSVGSSMDLFRLRKKKFYVVIIAFIFIVIVATLPAYINYTSQTGQNLMSKYVGLENSMNELFLNPANNIDCKIENKILVCENDESLKFVHQVINDGVTYTVLVNPSSEELEQLKEEPAWNTPSNYDNYVSFTKEGLTVRYVQNKSLNTRTVDSIYLIGGYGKLDGFDFGVIQTEIQAVSDQTIRVKAASFYSSTIVKQVNITVNQVIFLYQFITVFISIFAFIFISAIILKGNNLFNKGKGFKFKETFKIAVFASFQPLAVSLLVGLLFKIEFTLIFSISYLVRIVYLYFKFLTNKNTTLFDDVAKGLI